MESLFLLAFGEEKSLAAPAMTGSEAFFNKLLDRKLQLNPAGKGKTMLRTILIILLVLFLLGALPSWPYSAHWGYYPSGGLGLVLIVVRSEERRVGEEGRS